MYYKIKSINYCVHNHRLLSRHMCQAKNKEDFYL